MPSAMVDTAYPESDEALRLCRELDEPLADALPMRLWCWGIETNRTNGRFMADAKQLAQIVRFEGNPDELLRAFLSCDVIESTDKTNEYRIKGWKLNARFFKERDRLRRLRKTQKARVQKRVQHADKNKHPSSSSSSSPDLNTNTGEARAREETPPAENREPPQEQPETGELPGKREHRSSRGAFEILFENAFIVAGANAKPAVRVAKFSDLEKSISSQLMRRARQDQISDNQLIAEWWNPAWRAVVGWQLHYLEKHYAAVLAAIHDPAQRPKPRNAKPAASSFPGDDSEKRRAAHDKLAAENSARLDAMRSTAKRHDQT